MLGRLSPDMRSSFICSDYICHKSSNGMLVVVMKGVANCNVMLQIVVVGGSRGGGGVAVGAAEKVVSFRGEQCHCNIRP